MTSTFGFGDNWLKFVADLNDEQIAIAQQALQIFLNRSELSGLKFLDIGSGSGLHSLVARKLGARVHSFDFDQKCVACTKSLRDKYLPGDIDWKIENGSILDEAYINSLGTFDLVYSWGVLHHTGAMWVALRRAASLVAPGGTLAIALYRKTPLCEAWKIEKRLYSAAPPVIQAIVRRAYQSAFLAGIIATGRNPLSYVRNYQVTRGMNWSIDAHDWLGGYPYESASAAEVKAQLEEIGFHVIYSIERRPGLGIFGTGCNEYICQR
jgi:2-polyprenyl-6-hydroxyphenyl methylase/3-demethylubiquinone-9 3-methyltransferase